MGDYIKVDKQGRIVLPARIRKILGMKEGGQLTIRLDGNRVILEPVSSNISEKVKGWSKLAMSIRAYPFTEQTQESWKWMYNDYARRKLGLS